MMPTVGDRNGGEQYHWRHAYEEWKAWLVHQKKNKVTVNKAKENGCWMAKHTNVHYEF